MFRFLIENNLISWNQSGFKPEDPCINQPLSMTHEIYKSFDDGFEVTGVLIPGKLFSVLSDFFKDRKQKVTLNGQISSWAGVNVGVPQELILIPLLFLVYISDIADSLSSNAKLFADNTSSFSVIQDVDTSANELNNDLYQINRK